MTTRAQEVMRAYEAEDTYNFPKDGVVAALRYVADRLYTDWGELQQFPPDMEVEVTDGFQYKFYKGNFEFQLFEDTDGSTFVDIGVGGFDYD